MRVILRDTRHARRVALRAAHESAVCVVCSRCVTTPGAYAVLCRRLLLRPDLKLLRFDFVQPDPTDDACPCPDRRLTPRISSNWIGAVALTTLVLRVPLQAKQLAPVLSRCRALRRLYIHFAADPWGGEERAGGTVVVALPALLRLSMVVTGAPGLGIAADILRASAPSGGAALPALRQLALTICAVRRLGPDWSGWHVALTRLLVAPPVSCTSCLFLRFRRCDILDAYLSRHCDEFYWLLGSAISADRTQSLTLDWSDNERTDATDQVVGPLGLASFFRRCPALAARADSVALWFRCRDPPHTRRYGRLRTDAAIWVPSDTSCLVGCVQRDLSDPPSLSERTTVPASPVTLTVVD